MEWRSATDVSTSASSMARCVTRSADRKTVWTRQLVRWQEGQTITGAPLYMDGKIFIGVVGADYGTRGFMEAIDATTGKSVWRFYTIPGPNEPGGDTWPKGVKRVPARGSVDLVDASLRPETRAALLLDGKHGERLVRR